MEINVVLVDLNPKMVAAWREVFADNPEVQVVQGSMLDQSVSAWVSPTNSRAQMDGGLDAAIRTRLGRGIQARVRRQIVTHYGDFLPVGTATCVESGRAEPRYLISTPTMYTSAEDVSATLNVVLACGAALQAARMQNVRMPGSIRSVALPGLGAGTGRVPAEVCADLMWTAYDLFGREQFDDFVDLRAALEAELGDLGPETLLTPYRHSPAARRRAMLVA